MAFCVGRLWLTAGGGGGGSDCICLSVQRGLVQDELTGHVWHDMVHRGARILPGVLCVGVQCGAEAADAVCVLLCAGMMWCRGR